MELEFSISCVPPKGTSQMKGIRVVKGIAMHYKKKEVQAAEDEMLTKLKTHVPDKPFEGPIELYVKWTYPWRSNEPKKNQVKGWMWKFTRPDCSNFVKLFEDCMTKLEFWGDDAQVARLIVEKHWGNCPGFEVKIKNLIEE